MGKGAWDQIQVWHLEPRRTGPRARKGCATAPCEKHSARCTMGAHQVRTQSPSTDRENSIRRSGQSARVRWLFLLAVTPFEDLNLK